MNKFKQAILNHGHAVRTGALALIAAPLSALAAVDTAPIDAAKTDGLAVAAAILGVMVAIWGARLVYRKFFGG